MSNKHIRTYYIYLITNKINGKNYVGKHKCPLKEKPWTDHTYMGSGSLLKKAKQRYGIKNFSKDILAICYSEEENCILEKSYIALYKSIGKAEYNLTSGGELCDYWNYVSAERKKELQEKDSQMMKELWKDENYRKRLSDSHKGQTSWAKGRKFSEEYKQKLSDSHKGNKVSDETKKKISMAFKGREISEYQKSQISKKNKGRHYFNNGEIEVKTHTCPEGFVPGRVPKDRSHSEEAKQKIREARARQVFSEESLRKRSESLKRHWAEKRKSI